MLARRSPARAGHTLVEVILVVAVLVLIGFVSMPFIQPMFADGRLQAAEDLVKARCAEMKVHAVSEGRAYRFAFQDNTGQFRIAPDDADFWGDGGEPDTGDDGQGWVFEGELPKDVLFCQADAVPQTGGDKAWTRAFTFLADGTGRENTTIAFGKAGGPSRSLKMQGVLGSVTSEEREVPRP